MQDIYNYTYKTNRAPWNIMLQLMCGKIFSIHDVLFLMTYYSVLCRYASTFYFMRSVPNTLLSLVSQISRFPYIYFRSFLYGFAMVPFFPIISITSLHIHFSLFDSVKCYFNCMNCYQCFLHMFIL